MRQQNISKNWLLVCLAVLMGLKAAYLRMRLITRSTVKQGESSVFRMPFEGNHTNMLATSLSYGGTGNQSIPAEGEYSALKINFQFAVR